MTLNRSRTTLSAIAILLLLGACGAHEVTREEWSAMKVTEKEMVVRSLLGGETAADAKGGFGHNYSKPADYYRTEIDRRYAAGETRTVNEVWTDLKD